MASPARSTEPGLIVCAHIKIDNSINENLITCTMDAGITLNNRLCIKAIKNINWPKNGKKTRTNLHISLIAIAIVLFPTRIIPHFGLTFTLHRQMATAEQRALIYSFTCFV